jgi:hypothetical protein
MKVDPDILNPNIEADRAKVTPTTIPNPGLKYGGDPQRPRPGSTGGTGKRPAHQGDPAASR